MDTNSDTNTDILIIGGGNAALSAAITAAEKGAKVTILESAPEAMRGGNSRHTRNLRCRHDGPLSVLQDSYSEEEYMQDLLAVTKGNTNEQLARIAIGRSAECVPWLEAHGVRFQSALSGTLSLERTNAFFLGGGKALVNALYRTAQACGVTIVYEADVTHLEIDEARVTRVDYTANDEVHSLAPKAVIAAAGGFQANIEWLERAWGPAARNFRIRGTPYNRGAVLADLQAQDVQTVGDEKQCHAVAIDGRAPHFDGGIVTRLDCVVYSVVVNQNAERFYDEGEDVWPKRYAIWGRLVAEQPEQVAYAIIDSRAQGLFMPSVFPPEQADTIEDLADKLGLDSGALAKTIETYNAACGTEDGFTPGKLDGLSTVGVMPAKTNWARRIIDPPFSAYALRPGITFTYFGLRVNERAQVMSKEGPVQNLWAAGEIMAGSILGEGYLAGFGMTIGNVFGRIAGEEAANYAR